ncbi:MAG: metallophosphoesterase [Pantoea sp.]|uniref:Serine/threonine-protein phosphatase n=1 Tax=Pantoea septica TaxID=472695 RepID=A0ABX3UUW5_9GAMM|nr:MULTISPECIES: metallophosphoesterase [Pantoea]MDU5781865.1 metallophosphoesterase [Pantoea sp.]ORN01875.1 serine/threonine-protein phosphatase [Pantoea septica]
MHYQYLNGENWQNIWIVGDLHGCRRQLDALLLEKAFDKRNDLLISVGDLIDRGPDSPGCLELLDAPWFRCVRGNHEEMALHALQCHDSLSWIMNGGDWFYKLRGARLIAARHALRKLESLPLILHLQLADRIVVVAHADYPAECYAWEQPLDWEKVVWNRERIARLQAGDAGQIAGADAFYFGHTPLQHPLESGNLHYIDTGAVFGNPLTLMQLQ